MKLWWYAILMLGLQLPQTAAAEENATETVPVDEFRLALALGYGRLDNPRVHAKPIETFLLPSWSYYSERFYLENFTLGYSSMSRTTGYSICKPSSMKMDSFSSLMASTNCF